MYSQNSLCLPISFSAMLFCTYLHLEGIKNFLKAIVEDGLVQWSLQKAIGFVTILMMSVVNGTLNSNSWFVPVRL